MAGEGPPARGQEKEGEGGCGRSKAGSGEVYYMSNTRRGGGDRAAARGGTNGQGAGREGRGGGGGGVAGRCALALAVGACAGGGRVHHARGGCSTRGRGGTGWCTISPIKATRRAALSSNSLQVPEDLLMGKLALGPSCREGRTLCWMDRWALPN